MSSEIAKPVLIGTSNFLRKMLRQLWDHPWPTILVLATTLLGVAYSVLVPLAYKVLFDKVIPERDSQGLTLVLLGLGFLFVINGLAKLLEEFLLADLTARVLASLRARLFDQFQCQSDHYFRHFDTGDLMSRVSGDVQAIERIVLRTLPGVLQKLLLLFFGLLTLFVLDWRLAVVATVCLPLAMWTSARIRQHALKYGLQRRTAESEVSQLVHENLSLQRTVRALGLETYRREKFDAEQKILQKKTSAMNFFGALVWRVTDLGVGLTQILIMGIGAGLAFSGYLTIGGLVAFSTLLISVSTGVSGLAGFMPEFIRGQVSLHRIEELLELPPKIRDGDDMVHIPKLSNRLTLREVTFGYTQEITNLAQANLTIEAGESIGIVGPSGAGKSTILNLLLRFYDPQVGALSIDNVDLRGGSLQSLRSQIALVPQDTALFNTTIRENIRAGRLGASDDDIQRAAMDAKVHDVIEAMPLGYDTQVGERGGDLSGGQRQRIAIARALIRRPTLLLLDEATSALDPETEAEINTTLAAIRQGRTVLSVTHRLANIVNYDRIVVIDQGRIAEVGSHQMLLAKKGVYSDLWKRQNGLAINDGGRAASVTPDYLSNIPWLKDLDATALVDLAGQFVTEQFAERRTIFEVGDIGDRFYILVRGTLDVELDEGDKTRRVASLNDGDWFGEIALLKGIPRTARVRARQESLCLSLHRRRFEDLLAKYPALRTLMENVAVTRLAELTGQTELP